MLGLYGKKDIKGKQLLNGYSYERYRINIRGDAILAKKSKLFLEI